MSKSGFTAAPELMEVLAVAEPRFPHGDNWLELRPAVSIMRNVSSFCRRPPPLPCDSICLAGEGNRVCDLGLMDTGSENGSDVLVLSSCQTASSMRAGARLCLCTTVLLRLEICPTHLRPSISVVLGWHQ